MSHQAFCQTVHPVSTNRIINGEMRWVTQQVRPVWSFSSSATLRCFGEKAALLRTVVAVPSLEIEFSTLCGEAHFADPPPEFVQGLLIFGPHSTLDPLAIAVDKIAEKGS